MTFTKLFSSITESTVWCESDQVRIVWITMLAMANWNGEVLASIPGLAHRARVPIEAVKQALAKFMGPDPYSRTKEYDGRRIEEIDGGWRLLNYVKHRETVEPTDREKRKEYMREYMREYRRPVNSVNTNSVYVNTDTDTDTDIDTDNTKSKPKALRAVVTFPKWVPIDAWDHYEEMRRKIRKPMTDQARIWAIKKLDALRAQGHDPAAVLEQSVFNSWQGLFSLRQERTQNGYKSPRRRALEETSERIDRIFREDPNS